MTITHQLKFILFEYFVVPSLKIASSLSKIIAKFIIDLLSVSCYFIVFVVVSIC